MPELNCFTLNFGQFLSHILNSMFLVCKLTDPKRQQSETDPKKVTEKELNHLNHKIDKLLIKLEDENDPQLATSPDEECVICISAKATMQTYPCGHRVVCRKCFVKTIQMVVSQRMLPLRCVICRSKILRLKQTTHGGLNTGHVLRNGRNYANTNPLYISPASSPVSPVTEVFREQRAVFVRHYVEFGYDPNGQSPVSSPCEAYSRSGGSNCVLHKHCGEKSKAKTPKKDELPQDSSSSSPNTSRPSSAHCSSQLNDTPFQWHFKRKRKYWRSVGRRRGTKPGSRPNSLLLPIDESEELQELIQTSSNTNDLIQKPETEITPSQNTSSLEDIQTSDDMNCKTPVKTPVQQSTTSSSSFAVRYSRLSATLMRAKMWIKRDKTVAH